MQGGGGGGTKKCGLIEMHPMHDCSRGMVSNHSDCACHHKLPGARQCRGWCCAPTATYSSSTCASGATGTRRATSGRILQHGGQPPMGTATARLASSVNCGVPFPQMVDLAHSRMLSAAAPPSRFGKMVLQEECVRTPHSRSQQLFFENSIGSTVQVEDRFRPPASRS